MIDPRFPSSRAKPVGPDAARPGPNFAPTSPLSLIRAIAAWAGGAFLAAALVLGGAAQAQNSGLPPVPRLPPPPPLPLFGPPAYTAPGPARGCGAQDWACRIETLERRVAELEREVDRGDRGGGRRGRSVDMSVDRDCISETCPNLATKLCANAGFARGVPIEVRQNGAWQHLLRATCLD